MTPMSSTTQPHTAATYARVSMKEQAEGDHLSLQTQTEACLNRAADLGLSIPDSPDFRVTEAHSGTDLRWKGSQLAKLLHRAKDNAFTVLIVYRPDRFGRAGSRHWLDLYDKFEQAGVEVRFVLNDIPSGQLKRTLLTMLADMAQADNANRVDATMRQKRARVAAGFPLVGPRPPYGYTYLLSEETDRHGRRRKLGLQPDPETAPVVVRMFAWAAAGWPLRKIAAQLDADNIPPPRAARKMQGAGRLWHPASLTRLLSEPTYWGERVAFRYTYVPRDEQEREEKDYSTHRQQRDRLRVEPDSPEVQRIPASRCPGLVDKDVAMQVQRRLTDNMRYARRNGRRYTDADVLLYGGIVRCEACGRVMTPRQKSLSAAHGHPERQTWQYCCNRQASDSLPCPGGNGTNISAPMVDTYVWQEAVHLIRDPDYFVHLIKQSDDLFAPTARRARAQHALEQADTKLNGLATELALLTTTQGDAAPLIREQLTPILTAWSKQRAEAQEEYDNAQRAVEDEDRKRQMVRSFRTWAQAQAAGVDLDDIPPEQRRTLILALHPRVFIAPTAMVERGEAVRIDVIFDLSDDPSVARLLDPAQRPRAAWVGEGLHTVGISEVLLLGQRETFRTGAVARGSETEIAMWRDLLEGAGYVKNVDGKYVAPEPDDEDDTNQPPVASRSW